MAQASPRREIRLIERVYAAITTRIVRRVRRLHTKCQFILRRSPLQPGIPHRGREFATSEPVDVMKSYIVTIGALALMMGTAPAIAQTVTATLPYGQTSALPAAAGSPAMPSDPNAPRWMLLEGYGRHGELRQHWQLVNPQNFDATNYHGFHTATD
jgi:hypothetical protein